jgi:hypothetical protein
MVNTVLNNRCRLDIELVQGGMGVVYGAHDIVVARPLLSDRWHLDFAFDGGA